MIPLLKDGRSEPKTPKESFGKREDGVVTDVRIYTYGGLWAWLETEGVFQTLSVGPRSSEKLVGKGDILCAEPLCR